MAGTSRALTLKLLADIDNFTKNINKADNEVVTFGDKITKFGKVAGAAFLAAGVAAAAYAGKLAIDGVKSAIEDEAAQAKLAATLRNVTISASEAALASPFFKALSKFPAEATAASTAVLIEAKPLEPIAAAAS